ncbi:: PhdYeFM_antitox [Gemmataceae bacterium]|nr:: PhdYeFM_antitox [Gemmataceae bacterium]VTT98011.1 : PhdYeFM_antitox [Gemmataceae bacterium]
MTTVTTQEARDRLPELLALVAAGEEVVIAENGKWVAALAAPPEQPPTPEEEAEILERVSEAIKATVRMWVEEGAPIPPGHPILELLDEAVAR